MKKQFQYYLLIASSLSLSVFFAEKAQALPSFSWSQAGPIPGLTCVRVYEDADPDAWSDNFLCSNQNLGLRWSQAGEIPGMQCTRIYEDADPAPWGDNYLCAPPNSSFILSWSQAGAIPGKACIRVYEDADPHAWSDNYLCAEVKFPITGKRDDSVANGHMKTSFTLTADGRLTAVTNTRTGVQLVGFTGATSIILVDENKQPIWASSVHTYGVDGCTIGRCNRNDNWSANVPPEIMSRVRGYAILQEHEPRWRIFDKAGQFLNWLNSSEGRATVATIVSIAVSL